MIEIVEIIRFFIGLFIVLLLFFGMIFAIMSIIKTASQEGVRKGLEDSKKKDEREKRE
ncbi:MAG: hypothetical protein RBQ94_01735 [Methanimicrococcus sp.]|nr:hypothetical protein [Methanimicrococcus sp.]